MSPVTPRPWLFAALAALASCSLQHPSTPGDAGPDVDVPGDTLRPDADVPPPDDVADATDVADADATEDVRDAANDADAAMDAPDVVADADAAMDAPDADAPDDVSDAADAGDAMDAPDADAPSPPDVPDVPVTPDVPDVPVSPDAADASDACSGGSCVFGSCAEIPAGSTSGVYRLRGLSAPWRGWCEVPADGWPAWTLVMKVDGSRATFQFDAVHWYTTTVLGDSMVDLDPREAKYEGFNATPVRQIRLRTSTVSIGLRELTVTVGDAPSPRVPLGGLMQMRPPPVTTITGVAAWESLFPGARLQSACQRFGLNVNPASGGIYARVRLGGVGDESDATCTSPDSWVGVGGFVNNSLCGSAGNTVSAGNVYGCDGANPARQGSSFTWIFVR